MEGHRGSGIRFQETQTADAEAVDLRLDFRKNTDSRGRGSRLKDTEAEAGKVRISPVKLDKVRYFST